MSSTPSLQPIEEFVDPDTSTMVGRDQAQVKNGVKKERIGNLLSNVEQRLQLKITEASNIHKLYKEAKTKTKHDFYQKKFSKINGEIRYLTATFEQLKALSNPTETENELSPTAE